MPRPDRSPAGSDRAAKVAKIQKAGAAADRRRSGLIWGAVALILVLIVGLVAWAIIRDSPALVDLSAVEEYENSAQQHTTEPVEYDVMPPVGGEHHPTWFNCGVYQEELPLEHVVHSLEHGAVWLTYQPDLPADQVEVLEDLGEQEYMMVSPLAAQDSPVVATSWDTQLTLEEADQRTLQAFIREYKQGPKTPEPNALCTNGTTIDLIPRG
ncbi:DUF3105 domain-containing protein [Ornithinimicrobium pratense]|uniref:DUF3105 domain-containing protein n=1 Tax=Ornithinimicrobium pratense TaxID=2593973 RepID=A0A5J6V249_9MICO|nr:DUF3105 domain-containing protein [Ornithinimicrobium pratense]QFG67960.1 DUF3105 domain-containing protein [Ornithinimicrobium pratense]